MTAKKSNKANNTTLKKGDNLPSRGMSNKNRVLDGILASTRSGLASSATRDQAEVAYFKNIADRAFDSEDKDSGMLLKFLGDKAYSSMKPTLGCVEFEFPTNGTPVTKAMAIVNAMATGNLSPDVGTLMIGIIKDSVIIEEGTDLKARIEELEKAYNV
jgi:hypothetical protein